MEIRHLYLEDGSVNPAFYQKGFGVWGTGGDGEKLFHLLPDKEKGKVLYWLDSDLNKVGTRKFNTIIRHPNELNNYPKDIHIALAFNKWTDVLKNEVDFFQDRIIFADYRYEKESFDDVQRCIICEGTCVESKAHFADFIAEREFLGNPPTTKLMTCKKCGFSFSQYRPNDDEMQRLYKGYRDLDYYKLRHKFEPEYIWAENVKTLSPEYVDKRSNMIFEFVSEWFCGDGKILDYGGDEGQLIPKSFSKGSRYVFDISGAKVAPGVIKITDIEDVYHGNWDFIMCSQVLEHVSNPLELISNMVKSIATNGYIYIEVPFETHWGNYSDYAFHEHINFFTVESLTEVRKRYSLKGLRLCISDDGILRSFFQRM